MHPYDKRVWAMMQEAASELPSRFRRRDVLQWFARKYPRVKANTITTCLISCCVNDRNRRHYGTRKDILYKQGAGLFERYDPGKHGTFNEDATPTSLVTGDDEQLETTEEIAELEAAAVDTALSLERDLERSLLLNLAQLEPGLKPYQDKGIVGQQLDAGKAGRIDIVAVDSTGNLVVIELKAGLADDRVCGQILRYLVWVKENLAGNGKVRGIIVASDFSDGLRYAAKAMHEVTLKEYEVRFTFKDV